MSILLLNLRKNKKKLITNQPLKHAKHLKTKRSNQSAKQEN